MVKATSGIAANEKKVAEWIEEVKGVCILVCIKVASEMMHLASPTVTTTAMVLTGWQNENRFGSSKCESRAARRDPR